METASPKTIYFPICLLKNFEEQPQETAQKIQTFCYNQIATREGKDKAVKKIGYTIFKNAQIEAFSPITFFNLDFIKSIANGAELDYELKCIFLFVCAIRSILGKNNFCKTNWQMVAARANGQRKFTKKEDLNGIAKRLLSRTIVWKENLKNFAYNEYKIGVYSKHGIRGFFVFSGMELSEFISISEPIINKEIKQTKATETNKKIISTWTNEQIKELLKPIYDRTRIEPNPGFLHYARTKAFWNVNLKRIEEELIKYTQKQ